MIPSALSTSSIQAGSLRQAPFDRLPSTGSLRQAQGRQGRQGRQDLGGGGRFAESRCDSLGIKTVQALSKRASSGPVRF